jgi:hypothetical protein
VGEHEVLVDPVLLVLGELGDVDLASWPSTVYRSTASWLAKL